MVISSWPWVNPTEQFNIKATLSQQQSLQDSDFHCYPVLHGPQIPRDAGNEK